MTLKSDDIRHWIFDLDNTLYPAGNNLFSQIHKRIYSYISQRLNCSVEEAKALKKRYFTTYGTTLRGLMVEHDIPAQDFLDYVHDIDFDVLEEDHLLSDAIRSLKGTKIVYTNASHSYALKVMAKIGLTDLFSDVFAIEAANFLPKPHPASYQRMVIEMQVVPEQAVMVEDIARNLEPASEMGMKTVWVPGGDGDQWTGNGPESGRERGRRQEPEYIDYIAPDLAAWLGSLEN